MHGRSLAVGVDLIDNLNKTNLNYLEIGCFDGVNLRILAEKFPNKLIYGIDPFISDGHAGSKNIGEKLNPQKDNLINNIKNLNNIIFAEATSLDFYRSNPDYKKMNVSLVFIDGSHHIQDIVIDIRIALKCILNNSLSKGEILFHDLHIEDVLDAMDYLKVILQKYKIKYLEDLNLQGRFLINP